MAARHHVMHNSDLVRHILTFHPGAWPKKKHWIHRWIVVRQEFAVRLLLCLYPQLRVAAVAFR